MGTYIIRRLLLIIPTVWIVTLIIFFMIRLIPGTVVDLMGAEFQQVSQAQMGTQAIEHALGLDKPILTQYGHWIGNMILHGDLGNSLWKGTPVINDILKRWPVTVELGLMGIIISQLIALPIGIYSAIRQDTWGDYLARSFAILSLSIPTFWLATMVIVLPSIWWNYAPPLTYIPFNVDPVGNLKMFIIPAVVLSLSMAGAIMRMVRTMMLEVMRQDYIRTAWAKGLKERVIVFRHAIKNALIPVVTILGGQLTLLVGGTVIIENIFQLPGMGQLVLSAATNRDYTVITAVMLIFAVGLVFINLTVDLTYGFLDRRIQYR